MKLSIYILIFIAFFIFITVVFVGTSEQTKQLFGEDPEEAFELFKLTYQFLLITLVGGGIALLFNQIDKERQRQHSKRLRELDQMKEMRSELLSAYNKAKLVRRQLRALYSTRKTIDVNTDIHLENYDEQMELLSQAQLMFEVYKKAVDNKSLSFIKKPEKLSTELNKIESYLNEVLKEYQDKRKDFKGEPLMYKINSLKNLIDFIGPTEECPKFKNKFKEPMAYILNAIGQSTLS